MLPERLIESMHADPCLSGLGGRCPNWGSVVARVLGQISRGEGCIRGTAAPISQGRGCPGAWGNRQITLAQAPWPVLIVDSGHVLELATSD